LCFWCGSAAYLRKQNIFIVAIEPGFCCGDAILLESAEGLRRVWIVEEDSYIQLTVPVVHRGKVEIQLNRFLMIGLQTDKFS
jgi:hypothetical protein